MSENVPIEGTEMKDKDKIIEAIKTSKSDQTKATEEEFENFMLRVNEVDKIVKKLTSSDEKEAQQGMLLADEILGNKVIPDLSEIGELKVKTNRTIINKLLPEDSDPNKMSQESFKRSISQDAQKRYEDRKARNERADTYKRIGIAGFREGNYEKAVTYFTRAVEQRKDSAVLWNNRALSYIRLGLYEKALADCEWALKVNKANIKALLNSAKCHMMLGNQDKCDEFIALAKNENPQFLIYIQEFETKLKSESPMSQEEANNLVD